MKAQDQRTKADGTARWLEVFEIRSSIKERSSIESKLEILKCVLLEDNSAESVEFYRHAELPTDWCVLLRYNCGSTAAAGSAVGLRLLASLQEMGCVYHGIWRELLSCDTKDEEGFQ